MSQRTITKAEWLEEGTGLFGPDFLKWRFVCPICKTVATVEDFKPYAAVGAHPNSATCECIGRYKGGRHDLGMKGGKTGPCDYAGYGLFRLSPVLVKDGDKEIHSFAFDYEGAAA